MTLGGTWHLGDNDNFIMVTDPLQQVGYTVSSKQLEAYHPDLAISVKSMLELSTHLFPYEVRDARRLLQHGTLDCIDGRGMHVRFLYMLSLHVMQDTPDIVAASGKRVTVEYKDSQERNVPFIARSNETVVPVAKSEFDRLAPGWENRWKIALELEIDQDALMDYVFTEAVTVTPKMDGISFG